MNPAPLMRGGVNPAPLNWYYVYLLRSKKDESIYPRPSKMGGIYIGCTSNLYKRLMDHEKGSVYATKKILPVELVYFEAYKLKKEAFEREGRLKHHGSSLRNLKLRLRDSLKKGGAG